MTEKRLTTGPATCDFVQKKLDQIVQALLHNALPISNSNALNC